LVGSGLPHLAQQGTETALAAGIDVAARGLEILATDHAPMDVGHATVAPAVERVRERMRHR
jgi:hypothetical protein